MYRFLQKHGKKLLAVFAAFLMISFALPSVNQFGSGGGNPVIGRLGGDKLRAADLFEARQSWELLMRSEGGVPLALHAWLLLDGADPLLGFSPELARMVRQRGYMAVQMINQSPNTFFLLLEEARRAGVKPSDDQVNAVMTNLNLASSDPDRNERTRRAVAELLTVRLGFDRGASAIKVTEPLVRHELAELQQSITVNAIGFITSPYAAKVPAPTAEQLKAQFEKYADTIKGTATEENPFAFGYKYPNRVKLQYIAVPRSDVRRVVEGEKQKLGHDFNVEAQKYYLQNQWRYVSKPATTQSAATQASATTAPTTNAAATTQAAATTLAATTAPTPAAPAASTQPSIRPFAEVQQEVKDAIINEATDKRMAAIQERINSTLAADWAAYQSATQAATPGATSSTTAAPAAGATTQPATAPPAPPTALGVPYASFDYLKNLAAAIQKDFAMLPTVVSKADEWLGEEDLAKLPGVGQARDQDRVPLAVEIMSRLSLFRPKSADEDEQKRNDTDALQVMEPTAALQDALGTVYVARVSAAEASHKPATLTEVEAAVRSDVVTQQAFEMAKADATKLLEAARQQGLNAAAGDRRVISAGPLTQRPGQSIEGLGLTADAADRFVDAAFRLLSTPTSRPSGKPVRLIELPRDGRVIVGELGDVKALWDQQSRPMLEVQLQRLATEQMLSQFSMSWFNYDAVTSRLSFVPDVNFKEDHRPSAPPPPIRPLF